MTDRRSRRGPAGGARARTRRTTLRARLLLAAAYMLTVVVVALEIPLGATLEKFQHSDVTSRIVSYTAIVASAINDDLAALQTPNPRLLNPRQAIVDVARFAAGKSHARMVVVDAAGLLVYDSANLAPTGSVYAENRPEFLEVLGRPQGALPDSRRAAADPGGPVMQLITAPVLHDRQVIGAVRGSIALSALNDGIVRSWLGLAAIGLAVIAVGILLAWLLARSIGRPVERLEVVAEDLGRGDLEARAPIGGPEEVASLAASFNRMADAMQANTNAQRDFVANASHQLRTPMTGIRLRLEAIEGEGGSAAEQAAKAQRELARLTSLVDDLLALAKATSIGSAGSAVEIDGAVDEAVGRWTDTARMRGTSLGIGRRDAATVLADPADVAHVLDNLIENAILYAPAGGHITVEALAGGTASSLVVTDDGPGIPVEERERVFERFFRGSVGRASSPGTGLGLAIVGELVHRWGGEVRIADGPGGGARFEVRLPAPPGAAGYRAGPARSPARDAAGRTPVPGDASPTVP